MKKYTLIVAALSMLAFWGCVPKSNTNQNSNDSLTVDNPLDTVAVISALPECQTLNPGQFCALGLDILKIGDSLVYNNNIRPSLATAIMKDTVIEENVPGADSADLSTAWFAKIMRFPDGDILLEAGGQDPQALNRIQIHSKSYQHTSGLHVGSTGKELKAKYDDAYVLPFIEYEVMEIYIPYAEGRVFFHIPMKGIYSPTKEKYELSDIPDDAQIVRIVIM